jgi:hypothetical protein
LEGYTTARIDILREIGTAWAYGYKKCHAGEKEVCDIPPDAVVKTYYQGCEGQAKNLSPSVIREMILASLAQHPERLKWEFSQVYVQAIQDAFPCKHNTEETGERGKGDGV